MTITTYDEELCKYIEPNVCSTRERFEALKMLYGKDIPLADVYESSECITYLIKCGADVNIDENSGAHSPLALAVEYGYYDSVVVLVENEASIGDTIYSALYGSERVLRYLCENGADVNQVNSDGETPLMFSEQYSNILENAPEILKEYGAN